jgi:dTDP-glucose pyrophosphorylase
MKALILAGGRGSRLNEFTKDKNKSMITLFEKPLIEYNLEHAFEAKVSEIVIVVGYKKEEIMKCVGKEYREIPVKYAIQKKQMGLVNAIECSKEKIGNSDFILMLGDEIVVNANIKEIIHKFKKENLFAVCGITLERDKESISKTYNLMCNSDGRIFRLIEKPRFPINNMKGTGHCVFKNEIFDYIKRTPINANRGEKELVDMIQCAIDEGKKVYAKKITNNYVNVNTLEDYELGKELVKSTNPKILIIHPQMKYFGGAELLIVELCNWLTKKGVKNDILTSSKSKEVEDKLLNTKIIIPSQNIKINSSGFESVKDILKFVKIFRKELKKIRNNYDVINFHNFPSTWTLFPRKKPAVWMLNEPPNLWSRPDAGIMLKMLNRLRIWFDKLVIQNSVDIICVADEFNKRRCLQRYNKNSRVIYYGVNYDFFSKGSSKNTIQKHNLTKKFVVVQSGVLSEQKNQLESIKTINQLKDKIPNILLVLAGRAEEKYKQKLENYIRKNDLGKFVLFTGNLQREELRNLYKSCDVGLFPVGQQGGWLAPFEFLCSGNPIIVSNELGASSIIKEHGLGIVTGNYANALENIYGNLNEYKTKSKNATLFIKNNLGWDIFTDKMIRAYKDALK